MQLKMNDRIGGLTSTDLVGGGGGGGRGGGGGLEIIPPHTQNPLLKAVSTRTRIGEGLDRPVINAPPQVLNHAERKAMHSCDGKN